MTDLSNFRSAPTRLVRALARRRASVVILALAVVIALPSIAVGFFTDDYTYLAALRSGVRPFFDLFRFSSGSAQDNQLLVGAGAYPWWTAPDFKLHLIRPLTSVVFALDSVIFGDRPLGYHLDAIAWYVALLAAVALILRRVLPGPAGSLALLVFALRSGHVLPYAWLSARHVLIAAVPAMFALLAHLRAVKEGWKPGLFLAPLLLMIALSGSEIALAILPFWIAHDWIHARTAGGWKRALGWAAPALAIAALYLLTYRAVGGGAWSSPSYHNPLNDPAAFLRVSTTRVPILLADALLGVPVVFSIDGPVHAIVLAGVGGVALCALLLATCRALPAEELAALRWLLPAALVALCVGISGPPWGHVLLVPDLGFAALIGVLLRHGFQRLGARSIGWYSRAAATGVLVVGHVFAAPGASFYAVRRLVRVGRATEDTAKTAEIGPAVGARVFVMAAADSKVFFYPRDVLAVEAPGKVSCWSVLSGADAPHRLTRTGQRSFVLQPISHAAHDGFDALFFGPRPFAIGDEVRQCGATIRVDALEEGKPSKLSVELDEPLESPDLALLLWQDHRLRRFPLPAVGESTELSGHRGAPPSGHGPTASIR